MEQIRSVPLIGHIKSPLLFSVPYPEANRQVYIEHKVQKWRNIEKQKALFPQIITRGEHTS